MSSILNKNNKLYLPSGHVDHTAHGRTESMESFGSTISTGIKKSAKYQHQISSDSSLSTSSVAPAADVFPYDGTDVEELKQKHGYKTVKVVHWIRHAQGYHNVNGGADAQKRSCIDARLTPHGIGQCQGLAEQIRNAPEGSRLAHVRDNAELIITSPVTRCVQTALHSLEPVLEQNPGIPFIANEAIRETVNFNCDRRRPIHEIAADFPMVDFSVACPNDEDAIWEYYEKMLGDDTEYKLEREQAEIHVIADRTRAFFEWLAEERDEQNIIVCCHATVSRCIFNYGHPGKTACDIAQLLDTRGPEAEDIPVINYANRDAESMREDFKNCELRSMVVAYK